MLLEASLMNFILRMSKEIKWKVKVVLLVVLLINFSSWDIQGDQMEGESGIARSVTDELHSSGFQQDEMAG